MVNAGCWGLQRFDIGHVVSLSLDHRERQTANCCHSHSQLRASAPCSVFVLCWSHGWTHSCEVSTSYLKPFHIQKILSWKWVPVYLCTRLLAPFRPHSLAMREPLLDVNEVLDCVCICVRMCVSEMEEHDVSMVPIGSLADGFSLSFSLSFYPLIWVLQSVWMFNVANAESLQQISPQLESGQSFVVGQTLEPVVSHTADSHCLACFSELHLIICTRCTKPAAFKLGATATAEGGACPHFTSTLLQKRHFWKFSNVCDFILKF